MSITVSKISIEYPKSNQSYLVPNIALRNSINPSNGDICFVSDASGDSEAYAGKYANYIYTGNSWTLIGTQDSARSDLGSISIDLPANVNSSGTIFTVKANTRIDKVEVTTPSGITGSPSLIIGDATVNNRLFDTPQCDFSHTGNNIADTNYFYTNQTPITYSYNSGTNSTASIITITIYYGA